MKTYQIENEAVRIEFIDQGGCLTKMVNKKTNTNYLIHYADLNEYRTNPYFLGATIGRNAGRTFPPFYTNFAGEKVALDCNEGDLHLHGGQNGLQFQEWQVRKLNDSAYELCLVDDAKSLYEKMAFRLVYRLENNRFRIEMYGTAEVPTICNLTNHAFFNLNQDKATIESHQLKTADARLQLIDEAFVPTEEYIDFRVGDPEYAPFNFNSRAQVGKAFELGTQLSEICAGGIDLAYCFEEPNNPEVAKIELTGEAETNKLVIRSNQEACVIYTANKVAARVPINDGKRMTKYQGITFEMQRMPNYVHEATDYLTDDYYAFTEYEIL
ncbi:hypothetical protein [Listeria kieliensis]|uniref:Type-1 mutarotase n=1 Tax=Listeria kieliensis TaxID=1621700 RepID=A0A3D8TQE0_9LIST|nr:hypothetical protein [Listeria kieliensis]RDX01030.1 hypothetical protein UR08_08740 [Listeria kieliensis]